MCTQLDDEWWRLIRAQQTLNSLDFSYLAACRDMSRCGSLRCIVFQTRRWFCSSYVCRRSFAVNWANENLLYLVLCYLERHLFVADDCWSLSREKKAHVQLHHHSRPDTRELLILSFPLLRFQLSFVISWYFAISFFFFYNTPLTSCKLLFASFLLLTEKSLTNKTIWKYNFFSFYAICWIFTVIGELSDYHFEVNFGANKGKSWVLAVKLGIYSTDTNLEMIPET